MQCSQYIGIVDFNKIYLYKFDLTIEKSEESTEGLKTK